MAASQQLPVKPRNGWLKVYQLIQFGVEVYKVRIGEKTTTDESVVGKEDDHVSKGELEKAYKEVEKDIYLTGHKRKFGVGGIVLDSELIECLSEMFDDPHLALPTLEFEAGFPKIPEKLQRSIPSNVSNVVTTAAEAIFGTRAKFGPYEVKMIQVLPDINDCGDWDSFQEREIEVRNSANKELGVKPTGDVHNVGTAETKSQGTKGLKAKALSRSNVNKEPIAKTKATDSKGGKETGVEKELKATEKELKATQKELKATQKELKATEGSDSGEKAKATEESDAKQESKDTEEPNSRKKAKAAKESDYGMKTEATVESYSRQKVKVTKKSDYRKKAKATEDSSAKQELKATEESSCEKEAKVTMDESEVGKGTDNQEEKESSRPGSKNVRTCMTCGLQEPAPKMFKKCKRCKDEGCLDAPYYCGRDCQVLDWTGRHRQEHEKN